MAQLIVKEKETICVVGLGYIGLPTALILSAHGNNVIGVDIDEKRLELLNAGIIPFEEDGLEELFLRAKENISFTGKHVSTEIYIITVPTPFDKMTKRINAEYVIKASEDVAKVCLDGAIIIIESTISPGTIDKHIRPIFKEINVKLVHAPERIMPGRLVKELVSNARTIGADDKETALKVKTIYETFCKGEIVLTDIKTAEMTKVVENTFRDISIAYANELVKVCRAGGMDVHEIIRIANKHPRVKILQPGPGVGGHCIPVDPWFLVGDYPVLTNLIRTALVINDSMPCYVLERIVQIMEEVGLTDLSKVGFYGLTYKENVDDVRESPTLQLLNEMHHHMASPPTVYDPFIKWKVTENQVFKWSEFINGLEMVVIMVAHNEVLERKTELNDKVVLDTRNCLGGGVYLL